MPATPKTAGDNRGGQNNKRNADLLDSRSTSKQVASVEEDMLATQASSQRQRTRKKNWHPKLTFEQMLDAPCKMHTGAKTPLIPSDSVALHSDCHEERVCRSPRGTCCASCSGSTTAASQRWPSA
ncbi:hypothetical protein D1007_12336 [Hordeum vulgare]|nr:hypothetical protein D1007_12336 [Hordeum vulgare]